MEMGDGALSYFVSAVEAANRALEIQRSMRYDTEIMLRIAIHIRNGAFQKSDVFCDGANVASRIALMPEPGSSAYPDKPTTTCKLMAQFALWN